MTRTHSQETDLMRKQISTLVLSSAVLIAGLVLSAPAEAADRTPPLTFEHLGASLAT